jgi:hypothetical protein
VYQHSRCWKVDEADGGEANLLDGAADPPPKTLGTIVDHTAEVTQAASRPLVGPVTSKR